MLLGEKIKKLRMEKGLSQAQVAGDRITRNMLSQIENGVASPSMKTLEHLSTVLGVSVAYLLSEPSSDLFGHVKEHLKRNDPEEALRLLDSIENMGDEYVLLKSKIFAQLAKNEYVLDHKENAICFANTAIEQNNKTFYRSEETEVSMRWILAHCLLESKDASSAMEEYKLSYEKWGWEARNHLLRARFLLITEQVQAAEREIWTITNLPYKEKSHYLLLRGWISVKQEKYERAVSYLKEAEHLGFTHVDMQKELYMLLETTFKELDDYKSAYEYAAKLREIQTIM